MKIYTKTGDDGTTGLLGGQRARKSDSVFDVLGDLDELSAHLGVVRCQIDAHDEQMDIKVDDTLPSLEQQMGEIQQLLLDVGARIAGSTQEYTFDETVLEKSIDEMTNKLPNLKNFILPGGHITAAHLHVARAVCRRVERHYIALEEHDADILKYLNRLSDYLFTCARFVNSYHGQGDIIYKFKK